MMRKEFVIHWHQFGAVIYQVKAGQVINLGRVDSDQLDIKKQFLSKYAGNKANILLSDSRSSEDSRLEILNLCSQLNIKVTSISTETEALTYHQNPVIGICRKHNSFKFRPSHLFLIMSITSLIGSFLIWQNNLTPISKPKSIPTPTSLPTPTVLPTIVPSPSPTIAKPINQLRVEVLNGTTQVGFAKSVADQFLAKGFVTVSTGNAKPNNFPQTKLIFATEVIKNTYLDLINNIKSVLPANTLVDPSINSDIQLILGTN